MCHLCLCEGVYHKLHDAFYQAINYWLQTLSCLLQIWLRICLKQNITSVGTAVQVRAGNTCSMRFRQTHYEDYIPKRFLFVPSCHSMHGIPHVASQQTHCSTMGKLHDFLEPMQTFLRNMVSVRKDMDYVGAFGNICRTQL